MIRSFLISCLVIVSITLVLADELQRSIPDSEKALVTQAKESRLDQHDLAAAENVLKDVLKRYPNYYKAHYNLGLVYQEDGHYDSAISELETARSIRESQNLQDYSIYNTLGWVYMQKGEMTTAEKYYLKALNYESKNSPDSNTRLYNNLSWFYYTLGKPDQAQKYADVAANKYHSTSAAEMKRLIEQLKVDKQTIKAKSTSLSGGSSETPHD
jgi:Tfp pilus assembly protein PilF